MHQDVATNLELQLSEIEMLQSMFPQKQEFQLDDPLSARDAGKWLSAFDNSHAKDMVSPPPSLSFSLTLRLEERIDVVLAAQMNKEYPSSIKPETYVKSPAFSRESQARINEDLKYYVQSIEQGSLVLGSLVSWIQEHGLEYVEKKKKIDEEKVVGAAREDSSSSSSRLWIYSHHIYSKVKRKDLLDLASDFNLTGFCMPGKPGIICLEGGSRDAGEAWGRIKSWNWKKIGVRLQEELGVGQRRRFDTFEEIGFVKSAESRDYHMDMGEFFNYLKRHESDYMFKELFGIDKG